MMNWNAYNYRVSTAILNADRLGDLLADLDCGINCPPGERKVHARCPVHGGEDKNFQLRTDGEAIPINWKCYSHHCEQQYKPSLLGLVRGILTCQGGGPKVPIREAVEYLDRFVADLGPAERRMPNRPRPAPESEGIRLTRQQVRARLDIPSPYFLSLGFSPAILDTMDVGHSRKLGRSVVPLYDDTGEICVGFITRQELPTCEACSRCHSKEEGCSNGRNKWEFPKGFVKSSYLYDYAAALRSDSPFVVLVEGAKEVWKLREARVPAVACLGSDLSTQQAQKLARLGKQVLIAFDNDKAGREGTKRAFGRLLERLWFVCPLPMPTGFKDLAEMPAAAVVEWFQVARRVAC
jgi:hypothetical protein